MTNKSLSAPFVSDENLLSAAIRARNLINAGKWEDADPILAEACRKVMLSSTPPAMPDDLVADVTAVVNLLEKYEWAEHCTKTVLGQRLGFVITELQGDYGDKIFSGDRYPSGEGRLPRVQGSIVI